MEHLRGCRVESVWLFGWIFGLMFWETVRERNSESVGYFNMLKPHWVVSAREELLLPCI